MTKKEIRKAILEKENKINKTRNSLAKSQDTTEVRSLGEVLDKLTDELNELKAQEMDSEDDPEDNSEESDYFGLRAHPIRF